MIGRLVGEVVEASEGVVLIDVHGVGYEVRAPLSVQALLPDPGSIATLWIRTVVREDDISLYGFGSRDERRLFDLLTGVNGCGPKHSLALLGQVGEETILRAVQTQDPKPLTRATGVGARLAERIILELKDKVDVEIVTRKVSATPADPGDELVEALQALGYRRAEAEAAAQEFPASEGTLEDRLRLALRRLQR